MSIGKDSYENTVVVKRNKKFFKRLTTVGSYYKKEEWERDYQRQLTTQRFMRQVNIRCLYIYI
jgi:hypothetical protein